MADIIGSTVRTVLKQPVIISGILFLVYATGGFDIIFRNPTFLVFGMLFILVWRFISR